jgi:tripartite-type tricarboxylate transporter receptor subunit TctC
MVLHGSDMTLPFLPRRKFLASAALTAVAGTARAQNVIPDRQVRLIVGFGSGNGTDTVANELAPRLERRVGRHVTVENRIGESGATAGEGIKNGPADGSFQAILPSTTIAARIGNPGFPFDPETDMTPITLIGKFPLALAVSPSIDVHSYEEYLKWLGGGGAERAKVGSTAASTAFMACYGKMMSRVLAREMKVVGFRGGSAMVTDVESGRVPACISNLPTLLAAHRGRRVRIILLTGSRRSQAAPQLPTAAELGVKGLELREWYMWFTNGRTPAEIVQAWNGHARAILDDPDSKGILTQLGLDVETTTPGDAKTIVAQTLREWRSRMEAYGVLAAR